MALSLRLKAIMVALPAMVGIALFPVGSLADPLVWPRAKLPDRQSPAALATEARVKVLLQSLSLEQKVGQMIQAEIKSASPADVKAYHLGSILNGGGSFPNNNAHASVQDWTSLADRYYAASMDVPAGQTAIPVIWGVDAVHGHNNVSGAVLFPHNIGLGAGRDPALTEAIGAAVASEVRSTGIDWVFAPTLAVVSDGRWGRAYEGFGDDPALVEQLGQAYVRGLQGSGVSASGIDSDHVAATAKHFIGDGGTDGGADQGDTRVSEQVLRDRHGAGYYGALAADVQTVMVSFSSWNGDKLHAHRHLITDVLKTQMGFDGLVVSDWNAIGQVAGCSNASCPDAINAGIDMIMAPSDWKEAYQNLLAQAKSGAVPMSRIDDAVGRILRVKLRSGLFDGEKPSFKAGAARVSTVGSPAHRALARRAVRQSLVLLKNAGGVLPLKPSATVLVAGSGADNIAKQSGGWSLTWQGTETSNSDFPGATSLYQGIAEAVKAEGGSAILSPDGTSPAKADVAIVVIGEDPYAEGRGDIRDLAWSLHHPADLALIKRLKAAGMPVVTVFLSGRPLWTSPEINASDAFIAAWLPGTEGGGVADLLFKPSASMTAYDFTGRLAFAWPANGLAADYTHLAAGDIAYPVGFGLTLAATAPTPGLSEDSGLGDVVDRSETVFFDRTAIAPWRVFLGDEGSWQTPLGLAESRSAKGYLTVSKFDHLLQEDALHAVWNGKGMAQIYIQSAGGANWSSLLAKPQQLAFSLRVSSRPTASTIFRQDCIYPCGAKADITRLLNVAPLNQWVRVSVDMKCMLKAGLDPRKVETPFLINTAGKLDLSVSYIQLEPIGDQPPTIGCN